MGLIKGIKNWGKRKFNNRRIFLTAAPDWNLIFCIIFLNVIGLIMIYSSSYYYAQSSYGYEPDHFFSTQLQWVIIGIVIMVMISFIRTGFYHLWFIRYLAFAVAVGFMVALKIPGVGHTSHGATRWIILGGRTIQVAEPIKLGLIVFFASFLTKHDIKKWQTKAVVVVIVVAFAAALYKISNNMSTAMIVLMIIYFMAMVIDKHYKKYWIILMIGMVFAVLMVIYIDRNAANASGFRSDRILAWLHPEDPQYAKNEAYQGTMALYAIASGGFFGKGFGQSIMKFKLPEPQNDYILSIIAEELGLFGVIILTYLFVYLLYKIFRIYLECTDRLNANLTLGVFAHFSIQIVMNYLVVFGLFPTMGVTLPLISAGGTAAFFTLIELGIVLAVDKHNKENQLNRTVMKEMEAEDPYFKEIMDERRARQKVRLRKQRENYERKQEEIRRMKRNIRTIENRME